jgi:hypothetical protein
MSTRPALQAVGSVSAGSDNATGGFTSGEILNDPFNANSNPHYKASEVFQPGPGMELQG